jgi:hypothetical protein
VAFSSKSQRRGARDTGERERRGQRETRGERREKKELRIERKREGGNEYL